MSYFLKEVIYSAVMLAMALLLCFFWVQRPAQRYLQGQITDLQVRADTLARHDTLFAVSAAQRDQLTSQALLAVASQVLTLARGDDPVRFLEQERDGTLFAQMASGARVRLDLAPPRILPPAGAPQ